MKTHSRPILLYGLAVAGLIATIALSFTLFDILEDVTIDRLAESPPSLTNLSSLFVGSAIKTISGLGYPGIFVLMFLESVSLPVPSEVILPFSGYLVSAGLLNFWVVLFLTTLAGVLGAVVGYEIGYHLVGGFADHWAIHTCWKGQTE